MAPAVGTVHGAKPGGAHQRLPEAPTSHLFLGGGPQAMGQRPECSLTEVLQAAPRGRVCHLSNTQTLPPPFLKNNWLFSLKLQMGIKINIELD